MNQIGFKRVEQPSLAGPQPASRRNDDGLIKIFPIVFKILVVITIVLILFIVIIISARLCDGGAWFLCYLGVFSIIPKDKGWFRGGTVDNGVIAAKAILCYTIAQCLNVWNRK